MPKVMLGDVAKEYKCTIKDHTGMPVVGLEHIEPEELALKSYDVDDEKTFNKGFKQGHILFGRRRAYLKKAAVAPFDGVCSSDIIVIEAIPGKILPDLLPFIIQNELFFDYAMGKSAGGLSPRVKWKDLKEYEFDLPGLSEQSRLLDILKSAHEARSAYKEMIEAIDELVKSHFIEMFGDPFENPKGYIKKTIGDVCEFQGGSQPPRKEFIFEPRDGYIRLIQIRDYKTDEYITYAPKDHCRRFCDADDIMIGRYGPPIFQILQGIEGAYNVALMKAIPHGIDKEFMRAYLKRDELLHHLEMFSTRTAGQAGIEMSELRGYPCLVPPIEEQRRFVDFVKQSDKSKIELKKAIKNVEDIIKTVVREGLD